MSERENAAMWIFDKMSDPEKVARPFELSSVEVHQKRVGRTLHRHAHVETASWGKDQNVPHVRVCEKIVQLVQRGLGRSPASPVSLHRSSTS